MRFAVASTLLAQALPTWSLAHDQSLSKNELQQGIHHVLESPNKVNKDRLANLLGFGFQSRSTKELRLQKLKPSATSCDPDIGVLECAVGKYCQPDDQSARGGVCTSMPTANQGRKLEYSHQFYSTYCVAHTDHTDYKYYDCECYSWTPTSNATKFSCVQTIYLNNCVCADVCYDYSLTDEWERDGESWLFTSSSCFNFQTPYYQSICFIQKDDGGCGISLDGVECTSCTRTPDLQRLVYFDCENVGMGKRENSSDVAIPPIVQPCYNYDYVPCSLCPEGMIDTDAMVSLDDFQFSCSYLESVVEAGNYSAADCYYSISPFQATCCTNEVFQCNICGEEGMNISLPNNTVTFEGETFTCQELVTGSQDGTISEEICSLITSANVVESCGCTGDNGTGNTTAPPTGAPTVTSAAQRVAWPTTVLHLVALTATTLIFCA